MKLFLRVDLETEKDFWKFQRVVKVWKFLEDFGSFGYECSQRGFWMNWALFLVNLYYIHILEMWACQKACLEKTFNMNWPWKCTLVTVILHVHALVNRIWYQFTFFFEQISFAAILLSLMAKRLWAAVKRGFLSLVEIYPMGKPMLRTYGSSILIHFHGIRRITDFASSW